MDKRKIANTPIAIGTKIGKEGKVSIDNPTLYKNLVGSLMYLTTMRPNIMYGVSPISRFMDPPKDSHWKVGKRILRYISSAIDYGI